MANNIQYPGLPSAELRKAAETYQAMEDAAGKYRRTVKALGGKNIPAKKRTGNQQIIANALVQYRNATTAFQAAVRKVPKQELEFIAKLEAHNNQKGEKKWQEQSPAEKQPPQLTSENTEKTSMDELAPKAAKSDEPEASPLTESSPASPGLKVDASAVALREARDSFRNRHKEG